METIDLRQHFDYLIQCTEKLSLSPNNVRRYISKYELIFRYCNENHLEEFKRDDLDDFFETVSYNSCRYFVNETRKIAYVVVIYFEEGIFQWKSTIKPKYPISTEQMKLLNSFKAEILKVLGKGTVRVELSIIQHFLFYLKQSGKSDISLTTDADVLDFVKKEAPNHKQSMQKLLCALRRFIAFLRDKKIAILTADRFLNDTAHHRQKFLPCFSNEEIQCIFSQIDCNTEKGCRDFAVFLLALNTGLRASDISCLKLSDIDWNRKTISITQKKTFVTIELPLPVIVGNAIAAYILNFRGESDSNYVFLRIKNKKSLEPIEPSAFNVFLQEYIKSAGLPKEGWDGKTFHAFRRTAGTHMIETNTPVSTVSQILGHRNIESSKRYIALDTQHLMECGIELGSLNTHKEGLI